MKRCRLHVLADEVEHVVDAILHRLRRIASIDGCASSSSTVGRILERDLLGQLVGEGDELLALGDRGGLAAQLDDGADLRGRIDVHGDAALGRFAVGELGGQCP